MFTSEYYKQSQSLSWALWLPSYLTQFLPRATVNAFDLMPDQVVDLGYQVNRGYCVVVSVLCYQIRF